jgi:uncharacterized protein YeaO (DUF488 family)
LVTVSIKRVYEAPTSSDGFRVLVDRLWPRGLSKANAQIDLWLKDIAPSPELRTWWNHDPARMRQFAARYRSELDGNPAVAEVDDLLAQHPTVTLVYGARDHQVNHAVVLLDYLAEHGLSEHDLSKHGASGRGLDN